MNECDPFDCLQNRILAKVIGKIIPDNHGMSIHLDDKKFVVGVYNGKVNVLLAEEENWEDYQQLELINKEQIN